MSRVAFPLINFQTPDGGAVANGTVIVRLSKDGTSAGKQIEHKFTSIPLDSSGNVTGSPTVYPNSDILTSGSYYIYTVYTAQGQLVAGPNKINA